MSEVDTDDLPEPGWFDSESELPGISSVDSTIELKVNMSFSPADHIQEVRALTIWNSSAAGPALIRTFLWVTDHRKGQNPEKGRIF